MDQQFKDYNVFSRGSYWVYQDSATLNIDSVNLFSQDIQIADTRDIDGSYSEYLNQKFSSSFNHDTVLVEGGAQQYEDYHSCLLYNDNYNYILFFSNKNVGDSIFNNYYNNNIKYTAFYAAKNINGTSFYFIKIFENSYQQFATQPKKIYYSKKIGIVRKELFNGSVWNLIRYHIN